MKTLMLKVNDEDNMKKNLIIIGAGGHGKVVADIAINMNHWKDILFLDDHVQSNINEFPIIGKIEEAQKFVEDADFVIAIGNNTLRKKFQLWCESIGCSIATLVHPSASIGSDVFIGVGTVIMANCVVNSSSIIEKGCIINSLSCVEHDNHIHEFSHLSPGVITSGHVIIGSNCWMGTGTMISNAVKICSDVIVGVGGVVIKDITLPGTYIGHPVKRKTS